MSKEFIVRSIPAADPEGAKLILAREKINANKEPKFLLLQQLPNEISPTRILVSGEEAALQALLKEFQQAVVIEPNKKIFPL